MKMDEIEEKEIEKTGSIRFDDLPRDLKEKIWGYLEEKELYCLRIICKKWKTEMENTKSSEMRESYLFMKKQSDEYQEGKYFYKNFTFTKRVTSLSGRSIGLKCCYGQVFQATQFACKKKK